MASESTEDGTLTVSLPDDLDGWLDEQASRLGVDRETVLVQLLASYRAAAELDGDVDVDGQVPAAETEALEAVVSERVSEAMDTLREQLEERVDALEGTHREHLEDVRERVVQVKKETDAKAPRDHGHDELDRIDDIAARLEELEASAETSVGGSEPPADESGAAVEDIGGRLAEAEDRLETLAWTVSDLREARDSAQTDAVDRIKRAAAEADIGRARCQNCASGVDIALLTDPECPHCKATVTDVERAAGFFSKPRLLVASRLESGDNA